MRLKKRVIFIIIIVILFSVLTCILLLNKKDKKEVIVDNTIPVINVINDTIYIDGDSKFNPSDNIQVTYGKTGGKTKCNSSLKVGENVIKCRAKGKNGLSADVSYKVIMSKTYKKKAIFFGDSLVSGYGSSSRNYSWANYIGDNYDLDSSVNAGAFDYRVSTYDDPKKWLVDVVKDHYNDTDNYDFIMLEGGVNDVLYNTPIGSFSDSKDVNSFDPKTFCGGLETYLYYVTSKWSNSRIGYIITYYTPNYTERGLKWSYDDYKKYYDITMKILDKWNVKYINFATEEFNSLLDVEKRTYLPDYLHLNDDGYKKISPYIYKFMQELDKYK